MHLFYGDINFVLELNGTQFNAFITDTTIAIIECTYKSNFHLHSTALNTLNSTGMPLINHLLKMHVAVDKIPLLKLTQFQTGLCDSASFQVMFPTTNTTV